MMKFNSIILIILLAVTSSCTDTEFITNNIQAEQKQYVKLYADSLGTNLTNDLLPAGNEKLTVKGIAIYGDELYCTNFDRKRVEIFDLKTLQYKSSIIDEESNMESMDVYADDKYIYVTGKENPRSQVSVYDRLTKAYICRLGNGFWWSILVHSFSVASTDKYIYVRDKGDIKVFLKSEIGQGKSLNTYCKLDIDKDYIYRSDVYHDMTVMDSTLFVVNIQTKTIYMYDTRADYERNSQVPYVSKFTYSDNQSPQAIAYNAKYLFIATKTSSSARINIYNRNNATIDLAKPAFIIPNVSGNSISNIHSLAAKGDTVFINSNEEQVTSLLLKESIIEEAIETKK